MASLPGYFYGASDDAVWVHLYAEGTAEVCLDEDRTVGLRQRTRYPWDGEIEVNVEGEGEFGLMLPMPSWCDEGATVEVNCEPSEVPIGSGYVEVRRVWRTGDTVNLRLPMPVRRVECHPYVAENTGRIALMRGPILYCVEQVDNPGVDVRDIVLPVESDFFTERHPDLLGGVTILRTRAEVIPPQVGWRDRLYRTERPRTDGPRGTDATRITAVPYYAWANREPGAMQVWLRSR